MYRKQSLNELGEYTSANEADETREDQGCVAPVPNDPILPNFYFNEDEQRGRHMHVLFDIKNEIYEGSGYSKAYEVLP
jgi:hypothetical protein